ncbi:hypothetical protein DMENIID0001_166140 [Sergentomyia squamirostris]
MVEFFLSLQGVIIKEVIDGTQCDVCKDLCPGFEPHSWRVKSPDRISAVESEMVQFGFWCQVGKKHVSINFNSEDVVVVWVSVTGKEIS